MRYFLVKIPEGVTLTIEGNKVIVEGPKGRVEREFKAKDLKMYVKDGVFEVETPEKAMINTIKRHVANMIKGVTEGFEKHMVIRYSHFPITVEVKGNKVVIKNFLGERKPREARIMGNVQIEVKGQDIYIRGPNIEEVSQTAANIRQATKIRGKDPRVFQDGIYYALEGE